MMQAGLVHIHVGPGASGLEILRDVLKMSDIPITQVDLGYLLLVQLLD